jgi:PHP family Zn ribbon phosphoesterase
MSPRSIVRKAKDNGLDIIGICDHNSCENVPYIKKSAEIEGINVTGGIEITSREEVHVLALFDDEEALFSMQEIIYNNLEGNNDEKLYGDQVIVNENDEVVGFNNRLLIGATELSIDDIVNLIHDLEGIAIASHIDRDSFGIISQLGFVPEGLKIDAFEISARDKIDILKDTYFPLVMFSDAHCLNNIGKNHSIFLMAEANLKEMSKALSGVDGRKVIV